MRNPREIQEFIVNKLSMNKANLSFGQMMVLGTLAGIFIGFGAIFALTVMSGINIFGLKKFLGGAVFTVGLMLVVIAGAELFTGNVLMLTALYSRKLSLSKMLRNWVVVYIFNFVGSVILAWIFFGTHLWGNGDNLNSVGKLILSVANSKTGLSFTEAFTRGMLCNILVDLACILSFAAESVSGKILGIFFPISAFVASGFEHSVANMFFIPIGLFVKSSIGTELASQFSNLSWSGFFGNLFAVTLGNIVGPMIFVTLMYYLAYIRPVKKG